jgi:hypothetical protein
MRLFVAPDFLVALLKLTDFGVFLLAQSVRGLAPDGLLAFGALECLRLEIRN